MDGVGSDVGGGVREDAGPPPCGAGSVASRVREFRSWLAGVSGAGLPDAERVRLIAELEAVKGASSAAQARVTDDFAQSGAGRATGSEPTRTSRDDDAARRRSVGSQVALARRESPALGDRFVGLARALVHELPCTMAQLAAGAISERVAVAVARESACLSRDDRATLDARLAARLGHLGVKGAGNAARTIAAELDAASVVARMESAVRSRHVTVRPAPDGMAYLTVLGPLRETVGAYAAVRARAAAVVAGQAPDEAPEGRGAGAVMADTALRLMSGRGVGQAQPVEVQLVMTDRSLLGSGDHVRPVTEAARVPGHGPVPAAVARSWVAGEARPGTDRAEVWLRRLYTSPDGRNLVAMDSRRRLFTGLLRRMVVLRDDVCVTPWCEAPIVHADHTDPVRVGGGTALANASGLCARCNLVKESPGWSVRVLHTGLDPGGGRPRDIEVGTPTGHTYRATAPPLTGCGSTASPQSHRAVRRPTAAGVGS